MWILHNFRLLYVLGSRERPQRGNASEILTSDTCPVLSLRVFSLVLTYPQLWRNDLTFLGFALFRPYPANFRSSNYMKKHIFRYIKYEDGERVNARRLSRVSATACLVTFCTTNFWWVSEQSKWSLTSNIKNTKPNKHGQAGKVRKPHSGVRLPPVCFALCSWSQWCPLPKLLLFSEK